MEEKKTEPASVGADRLTESEFESVWKRHARYVRKRAKKTLRNLVPAKALYHALRYAPERSLPSLGAVCGGLRADPSLVDDVVQEVALAFWKHVVLERPLGRTERDVRCWLSRVTLYAAVKAVDQCGRSAFAGGATPPEDDPDAGEAADKRPSLDLGVALGEVLELLVERERLALLAAAAGVTHEEFAVEFGTTPAASRVLRCRAAKHAYKLLAA